MTIPLEISGAPTIRMRDLPIYHPSHPDNTIENDDDVTYTPSDDEDDEAGQPVVHSSSTRRNNHNNSNNSVAQRQRRNKRRINALWLPAIFFAIVILIVVLASVFDNENRGEYSVARDTTLWELPVNDECYNALPLRLTTITASDTVEVFSPVQSSSPALEEYTFGSTVGASVSFEAQRGSACSPHDDATPGVWYAIRLDEVNVTGRSDSSIISTTNNSNSTATIRVSTCDRTDFDTVLTVYRSFPSTPCTSLSDPLPCVVYNNDACGAGSSVQWTVPANDMTTYLLYVHGHPGIHRHLGNFALTAVVLYHNTDDTSTNTAMTTLDTPPNDRCDAATPLVVDNSGKVTLGSTKHATMPDDSLSGMTCSKRHPPDQVVSDDAFHEGVWYQTVVETSQRLRATTCRGTDFDAEVTVFTGNHCGDLTCFANDMGYDGYCTPRRVGIVQWWAEAGVTYWIYVDGFLGARGDFGLEILTVVE